MFYNYIEIYPNRLDFKWDIKTSKIDGEREEKETFPSSSGFYYYPSTTPTQEAFDKLKKCMIDKHIEEIERLEKSLQKLEELKYESISGV